MHRVQVKELRLRFIAAGPDPYKAAMAYARAGVAMEGLARLVEDAELHSDVDFDGERSTLDGRICVAARLGTIISAALCFGMAFLRGYFRYRKSEG